MNNFYAQYPAVSGGAAANPSVGSNGATAPTSSTEVAGINPSGNLQPISVDNSGNQNVNVVNSALPTGSATSANQVLEIAALNTIATNQAPQATAANQVTGNSSLATIATNTTGVATAANQTTANGSLASIVTNTANVPTVGQKASAASLPVVIASDQSAIPVTVASVPLPTGAATSALQTTGNSVLGSILLDLTNGTQITQITGTVPLPTGASTSANQTTGNTSLASIVTNTGNIPTVGQKASAASLPVVIASDQSSIPVAVGGTLSANLPIENVYSTTNITTGAYVQLVASTTNKINSIHIFDSSGQSMILAIGASGSEVVQFYVQPGGDVIPLVIPAGSRIAYKALTANAVSGYLIMSFLE